LRLLTCFGPISLITEGTLGFRNHLFGFNCSVILSHDRIIDQPMVWHFDQRAVVQGEKSLI
jgi:hypothetical protein